MIKKSVVILDHVHSDSDNESWSEIFQQLNNSSHDIARDDVETVFAEYGQLLSEATKTITAKPKDFAQ